MADQKRKPRSYGAPIGGGQLSAAQKRDRERERAEKLATRPSTRQMGNEIDRRRSEAAQEQRNRASRDRNFGSEGRSGRQGRSIQAVHRGGDPTGGASGRNAEAIRRELGSAADISARTRRNRDRGDMDDG
jgi:hypothetical protein